MRRIVIVNILVVLAVIAIGGITGFLWYQSNYFYSTDDAQISGSLINMASPLSGPVSGMPANVTPGAMVSKGQTLLTLDQSALNSVLLSRGTAATGEVSSTLPASLTDMLTVTAPINGAVVTVNTEPGATVVAGQTLMQIADLNNLTVTAYVDEGSIDNINVGQSVDITVDAYKGTSFTGHVASIVPIAASQLSLIPDNSNASGNYTKVAQRIPVRITLDSLGGKQLMPGMNCSVKIHIH